MPWCPFAEKIPSPNHSARTGTVLGAVQHSTVGAWGPSLAELCRPDDDPVSAHFLIGLDGRIAQLVDTSRAAWHAMSANGRRIGLEHVDDGRHWDPIRTPEQYAASARVNRWCAETHGYTPDETTIAGHRIYVATACPSGLDVGRIIVETQGGDMADYIERAEFDQMKADLKNTVTYIADRLAKDAHHGHGEPVESRTAKRSIGKLDLTFLDPAPKKKAKRATRAQVRAGHGR